MKKIIYAAVAVAALAFSGAVAADQVLAQQIGCMGCHKIDSKLIGPAFKDVAAKYRDTPNAAAMLTAKVKAGSKAGEPLIWGTMMMPASPAPEADVHKVIEWVLTLK